jgi:hypothetical protein
MTDEPVTQEKPVDPAGLLMAVLAVALAPLTTKGLWSYWNTVVSVIVLIVLWAYTWPRKGLLPDWRHRLAVSVVVGLTFGVASAWAIQCIFIFGMGWPDWRNPDLWASNLCMCVAALFSVLYYWGMGWWAAKSP